MTWVAIGVAGVGLLSSAYSAKTAGDRADRAEKLQQSTIQQDQAFRQQQLDQWNAEYKPMQDQLNKQASSEQPLGIGPNWANIQSNFDQMGRNEDVRLGRSGMTGSSLDRKSALEPARLMSLNDAFSKGLQNRDALRERLLNASKQMPGQVGAVSQGNQNMASLYGQQYGTYANAAGNAWQGFGNSLAGLGYALGNMPKTETAVPITTSTNASLYESPIGDIPGQRTVQAQDFGSSPYASPITGIPYGREVQPLNFSLTPQRIQ